MVECLLYVLTRFGKRVPSAARDHTGIFTPTGQPSDFAPGLDEKKQAFRSRLTALQGVLKTYRPQLQNSARKIGAEIGKAVDTEAKNALVRHMTVL